MAEMLFRERGFTAVSIADIAHALGMSPANVFKHFHSKTALADAITERHLGATTDRFIAVEQEMPAREQLQRLVLRLLDAHLQDIRDNPYIFEMVMTTIQGKLEAGKQYRAKIVAALTDIIQVGIAQGSYNRKDTTASANVVADVLVCVLHPVILMKEDRETLLSRAREIVAFIDCALRNNAC